MTSTETPKRWVIETTEWHSRRPTFLNLRACPFASVAVSKHGTWNFLWLSFKTLSSTGRSPTTHHRESDTHSENLPFTLLTSSTPENQCVCADFSQLAQCLPQRLAPHELLGHQREFLV